MKLSSIIALQAGTIHAFSERGLMWMGDRYLYDDPICQDIELCRGENGCNAKIFTDIEGVIKVQNYKNKYNCRWEIKGPVGSTIRVRIDQESNNFGIENQKACGFDRLHIQSGAGDRFGRFCSHVNDPNKLHNALNKDMAYKGQKIANPDWQNGFVELPVDHLVVGFDTDQETTGKGFKLNYEIMIPPPELDEFEDVQENLQIELDQLFKSMITKEHHVERMEKMHDNLFTKWQYLMSRCKNGDMKNSVHPTFDAEAISDPAMAKEVWDDLMKSSFTVCDLPITRKGYENSSWRRRVERYFARLTKLTNLQ